MTIACPCCNAGDVALLGHLPDSHWFAGARLDAPLPGGSLHRCRRCRLKFRHPVRTDEEYARLYDNGNAATWPDATARPDWDLVLTQVQARYPTGGRFLDFGCYSGGLLARLGAVYEKFGIEINHKAAEIAATASGATVWPAIEHVPNGLKFDVIALCDVVEHVRNPKDLLERLRGLLVDGGVLVVTTGDADTPLWNRFGANWWYCYYPEHISFLSMEWVERTLRPTEWRLLANETFAYRKLGRAHRLGSGLLARLYGHFPHAYAAIVGGLKKAATGKDLTSIAGNGTARDHIMLVLAPTET